MGEAWRKVMALLMLAALSLGVAACGDDDDDDVAASGDATEESEESEDGDAEGGEDSEGDGPEEGNPCAPGASMEDMPQSEEPEEGATAVTVTATDYAFAGAEPMAEGGVFAVEFVNDGAEMHEFNLVRLAEDEDRPLQEIISSGEEPELTDIAHAFACPGDKMTVNADVSEPGRYVAVCFVPVGSTPDSTEEPEGPPHAAQGMTFEFEVA